MLLMYLTLSLGILSLTFPTFQIYRLCGQAGQTVIDQWSLLCDALWMETRLQLTPQVMTMLAIEQQRVRLTQQWYNSKATSQGGIMTKYQVHFEYTPFVKNQGYRGLKRGMRTIVARNEAEAILKVKSVVQHSFGHWVNRLANEVA
jgi:hypothetical protein